MAEKLMYDTQHEPFWFPGYPQDRLSRLGTNRGINQHCEYTDVVIYSDHRENYIIGSVIPVALFKNTRIDPKRPAACIKELVFQLIPRYDRLDEWRRYGASHSPIQALEERRGHCIHRASIAAALAEANNLDYRMVGSNNLLTSISYVTDILTEYIPRFLARRFLRAPGQIRPLLYDLIMHALYGPSYPHWWIEICENGKWKAIDTVEWEPITLPCLQDGVGRRMVCKRLSVFNHS